MVARQVSEHTTRKLQTSNTLLGNGMAGAFHKHILAACQYHLFQQFVQFYGVRRSVGSGYGLVFDVVAHRR